MNTPTRLPARLPDPREVVAVMEALLRRPRGSTNRPSLPPRHAHTVPPAPLLSPRSGADLLGELVASQMQRPARIAAPRPTLPDNGPPTLGATLPANREQHALAALRAAAARPPVLAPISTLRRSRPEEQAAALPCGGLNMLAPSDLAPRAASRLLAPSAASAPSGQHLEPSAPDADGDELLNAITRGLVDQAWLRGVNLG